LVVGLDQVVAVAAGGYHSAAVRVDGTVWAWGRYFRGSLGDGTSTGGEDRATPGQVVVLGNAVAVSVFGSHTVAVAKDGTVWDWGSPWTGSFDELFSSNSGTPSRIGIPPATIKAVSCGFGGYALQSDGTVWFWSGIGGKVSCKQTKLSEVVDVAAGFAHLLAVRRDGTVWASGVNDDGRLGDGTTESRLGGTAVQVAGITDVVAVAAGTLARKENYYYGGHSVAVGRDGTVWTWGNNTYGQLGDGTRTHRLFAVRVAGVGDVVAVAAGDAHTVAVTRDGSVWAWGRNSSGQLGNGTTADSTVPVRVKW
jgi:alpha-tubulin suppressor-like RCC1 family protein